MRSFSDPEYAGSKGSSDAEACMIFKTRAGRFYIGRNYSVTPLNLLLPCHSHLYTLPCYTTYSSHATPTYSSNLPTHTQSLILSISHMPHPLTPFPCHTYLSSPSSPMPHPPTTPPTPTPSPISYRSFKSFL